MSLNNAKVFKHNGSILTTARSRLLEKLTDAVRLALERFPPV